MKLNDQKLYLAGFAICVSGAFAGSVYAAVAAATLFGVLAAEQMGDLLYAGSAR